MGTSMSESGGKSNMIFLLVVEDDPTMQLALREVLEREGYHVETASNGNSALEIMEEHSPDLILSDTLMPGMNGFELLEAVRSKPSGENDRIFTGGQPSFSKSLDPILFLSSVIILSKNASARSR